MSRPSKRLLLVNAFGALFYLAVIMQWLWSLVAYLPYIITFLNGMQTPIEPSAEPVVSTVATSGPPSTILLIVGAVVTVAVIGATIWALIKLPSAVGKAGHKMTQQASDYIVPVITNHAPISVQKKQYLTARIMIDIKLAVCIVPIVISAGTYLLAAAIPYEVTMLVAAALGIASLSLLSVQVLTARWLRVRMTAMW